MCSCRIKDFPTPTTLQGFSKYHAMCWAIVSSHVQLGLECGLECNQQGFLNNYAMCLDLCADFKVMSLRLINGCGAYLQTLFKAKSSLYKSTKVLYKSTKVHFC
ncbi:unnamed protein product [Rhodiola kirilowii]